MALKKYRRNRQAKDKISNKKTAWKIPTCMNFSPYFKSIKMERPQNPGIPVATTGSFTLGLLFYHYPYIYKAVIIMPTSVTIANIT